MGTSKGYISPTKPEWSKAKRAVSSYLRDPVPESRAKAVSKYAEAKRTGGSGGTGLGSSFSSAAGNILSFARGISNNGVEETLRQFGRDDLIGKSAETILYEMLDQFTNHGSTVEDSLALAALSSALEALNIVSTDDLGNMDLDKFLLEVIIAFVNYDFDFHFNEKISHGRSPEETHRILKDVHGYIDGSLRNNMTPADIGTIDLSKIAADTIVSSMLDDAFYICMTFYGVEA